MNNSGNVLAFIGDAMLSLQVREYLVESGITNLDKLQKKSTKFVSATAQAEFVKYMLEHEILSETELIYYKRGRNAKSFSVAKNASIQEYRMATGFESLWGYLYLSGDKVRLKYLWELYKEKVGI